MRDRAFHTWLSEVVPLVQPPGVVAFNFNIAQGPTGFEVELIGSPTFDPNNSDWACEEAWVSRPRTFAASYAEFGKEWEPFLEWARRCLQSFVTGEGPKAQTLRSAEAVTVGFVDGELVLVAGVRVV
jgi:hypothetical protein